MATHPADISQTTRWHAVEHAAHFAHVYESDAALVDAAGAFIDAALDRGSAAIAIATATHLERLRRRWEEPPGRLEASLASGQLILMDTAEVLRVLLVDGQPHRDRFAEHIGSVVDQAIARFGELSAFGEMVQVLAQEGRMEAAIALEDLWNELRRERRFGLLCAYRLDTVADATNLLAFDAVCQRHDHVQPTPAIESEHAEPRFALAELRQKAHALDRERVARLQGQARLAHLAAIIASTDDAIVSKSLEGIVRSWNGGAERIFGFSAEEMIGRSITMLIPRELRQEEDMILSRIRAGQRVEHFETERLTKDGRRIVVALTVSPIVDDGGRIIGASKIARDISARRQIEDQNAREARRLVTLNEWSARLWACRSLDEGMQSILDALIDVADADFGNVQLSDGEVLRFVASRGFDESFEAFFAQVRASDESACGRVMRTRDRVIIQDIETDTAYAPYREVARRAGYRTVVSLPLLTSASAVLGVVTVHFRQVHVPEETELHRMALYARHAGEFVQRCRAEQALLEADARKDEFLATLAHELRNPLAPIRSGVHALKLCGADAAMRERTLGILDRQAVLMTRLVDDLLDASRIRTGKIVLQRQWVDLAEVLLQAVEISRPRIDAGQHVLEVDMPPDPVQLEADPVRLAQIVANLLNNAAKYTPQGGRIVLGVRYGAQDVTLSVSDTGMGIAPDMLKNIFGMFAQLDRTLQRAQGGLGIGLSLVKALVELHGGTIAAFSEGEGCGSRFVVTLPR